MQGKHRTICFAATVADANGLQYSFVIKVNKNENLLSYVKHYGDRLIMLKPCITQNEAIEAVDLWNKLAKDNLVYKYVL